MNSFVLIFKKKEAKDVDSGGEHENKILVRGAVHVGVDVEHKDHIQHSNELRQVLDWHPCPDEDKAREFE